MELLVPFAVGVAVGYFVVPMAMALVAKLFKK